MTMTKCEPFACMECEEPKPLYRDGVCKACWESWQEWMDHLAASDNGEKDQPR